MAILDTKMDPASAEYRRRRDHALAALANLDEEYAKVRMAGGEQKLARRRAEGRMQIRERIENFIDPDAPFLEVAPFAAWGTDKAVGASYVTGIGVVEGTEVMISGHDASIRGGAMNSLTLRKQIRALDICIKNRMPYVWFVESGGGDLNDILEMAVPGGEVFRQTSELSSMGVPCLTIVFGNATAGGAYQPGLSDHVIMIRERSHTFLAGRALTLMATGEVSTDEELGGAEMHSRVSGLNDLMAEDEMDALRLGRQVIRRYNWTKQGPGPLELPVREPLHPAEDLLAVAPTDFKEPFDMWELIARVVDGSEYDEYKPMYGTQLSCGWAAIHGYRVGILANIQGILFSEESQKATNFIQLCNQRDIPLVFLMNSSGYMVGQEYERGGIIKHGSQMVRAVANSRVPHITIIPGSSYGAANYGMSGRGLRPNFLFCWPTTEVGVMGTEQMVGMLTMSSREAAEKRGREWTKEQEDALAAAITERLETEKKVLASSGRILDDGVIDPRDTRDVIGFCLSVCHNAPVQGARNEFGVLRV
ncbi:acyl-CoA carboxylase subunit beta [Svornostia abyssi]|uniref:Acyl-CoA carboxylase subunit beta n=1 Tax=Svornostia abyssi TaxID=2898438 RepID=A0ABY5PIU1_9ACTN|nr:acyl-CoA carboxylase subunit beta [Parviterribacteraceae bacterium J379]